MTRALSTSAARRHYEALAAEAQPIVATRLIGRPLSSMTFAERQAYYKLVCTVPDIEPQENEHALSFAQLGLTKAVRS